MPDRLSALDVSFLYLEEPTTPMHVGSVGVFETPESGFGFDDLVDVVRERLAYVPRYRQRVRWVPGNLAHPVWVDDEDFDLTYHVRRSAVPRPGTPDQLRELVARIMSRPLDRSRPLWEMYLVEGLEGGRFALLSKTHQAMVDGISTVDIGQVVLDTTPHRPEAPADTWTPSAEPSSIELLAGALVDVVRRPGDLLESAQRTLTDLPRAAARAVRLLGGAAGGVATAMRTAARPAPTSPLNVSIGAQRRFASVDTSLDDYRAVRRRRGVAINDVVLATIAGALRSWLFTRGVRVVSTTTVRALVPMSVLTDDSSRSHVAEYILDLPVGEANPAMRLQQVAYATKAHREASHAVRARALAGMAGFAPPTLHALGARVASSLSRRVFNLVVTNVPGPQTTLYVAGAPMVASYPVVPLAKGQALAIGLTSYKGKVCFGLNADRDAMPDLNVLAQCIPDALTELVEAVEQMPTRPDRRARKAH
ncbi:WS/DGAT/MGAT family O-acyltransferase [Thermasporomyces composti]|jgi:WS/DGAT/MGAT family acyltransferase|uniref:Diacylglycerol O-acyltransferase n=1 Tax=Thermasporomyces composti TaxID=696763 RepID=A0A3D9V6Z2_THECX|nr:wax ester/triacylglycerol synthase family O-acyltransferase [Thermasporomyces composti]REF37552.1 WS/DGAT/MGAT family acyltransferase [Thermasporomyces composti]